MYRILGDVFDRVEYGSWSKRRKYSYYNDYGRTRYSSPKQIKTQSALETRTRQSYAHLILKAAGEKKSASFYDINLKANYNLDENNKLYLSGYLGRDNFNFEGGFSNGYGNLSGNLRWNHIYNDRLFSNLSTIYSKYNYDLILNIFEFDWKSSINNFNLKYDFKY